MKNFLQTKNDSKNKKASNDNPLGQGLKSYLEKDDSKKKPKEVENKEIKEEVEIPKAKPFSKKVPL